ncbi:unnamed protein product [Bursaphelenchus xylophilus]|uniref:(pine wood nematode) hypothetical protein n=1 Tax=Bursaphelenchus xylophilus TaxID=6326 RepID=A0A1I7RW40_BURXY|nr:unnamed protein product [Bursaphelenchus xylophilus]CAG9095089.1 unnamed protein product [Bursaphelenchus xylophilus]
MRSLLFALLVLGSVSAGSLKVPHDDLTMAMEVVDALKEVDFEQLEHQYNPICEACKLGFTITKRVIGDVNNLTKESLEKALEITCFFIPRHLPGRKEFCEKIIPGVIDLVYHIIKEVDNGIYPERDCQLILLCPRQPTTAVPTEAPCTTTPATTTTAPVEPITIPE